MCEFFNWPRNICEAKKIVEKYGAEGHGLWVARLRKGYKDKYCKHESNYKFCMRRLRLHDIIKYGDYDDG